MYPSVIVLGISVGLHLGRNLPNVKLAKHIWGWICKTGTNIQGNLGKIEEFMITARQMNSLKASMPNYIFLERERPHLSKIYSFPWVPWKHLSSCNQYFPHFPHISQYVQLKYPFREWDIPFFIVPPPMDGVGILVRFFSFCFMEGSRFIFFINNCNTLHWILCL